MAGRGFDFRRKTPAQRCPRGAHGERRILGNLGGERMSAGAKIGKRRKLIGKAPLKRFFSLDAATGLEHQVRALQTDEAR